MRATPRLEPEPSPHLAALFLSKNKQTNRNRTAAALKKIMDKETQELLVRVKHIIAVYTGDPEEAEDLEQNALKIIMKAYNLHSANIISENDFKPADEPLRKALRLILKVYDNLHKLPVEMQKKTLEEKFYVIAILFENVQDALKKLLTPHLKEASINRIDDTFKIMATHEFFHSCWSNEALAEDVKYAMDYMRELTLENEKK